MEGGIELPGTHWMASTGADLSAKHEAFCKEPRCSKMLTRSAVSVSETTYWITGLGLRVATGAVRASMPCHAAACQR